MSLFENLVMAATGKDHSLIPVRPVVEKEILHQEILRVMAESELLQRLDRTGTVLVPDLVLQKLHLRAVKKSIFLNELSKRLDALREGQKDFLFEMKRFLPGKERDTVLDHPDFWQAVLNILADGYGQLDRFLQAVPDF